VSSDPPEAPTDTDGSATAGSGVSESDVSESDVADATASPDGDADRSYEERVLDRLVPEIDGIDADADTTEPDLASEPAETADHDLSNALDEVDDDLLHAFVGIVVSIKAGILLISVGLLLVGFQDMLAFGGSLIAVGCLAFARAGQRYRTHERTGAAADEPGSADEGGEAGRNG